MPSSKRNGSTQLHSGFPYPQFSGPQLALIEGLQKGQ